MSKQDMEVDEREVDMDGTRGTEGGGHGRDKRQRGTWKRTRDREGRDMLEDKGREGRGIWKGMKGREGGDMEGQG